MKKTFSLMSMRIWARLQTRFNNKLGFTALSVLVSGDSSRFGP